MKWLLLVVAATVLVSCTDKKDEADEKRKQKLNDMYKTPPKSDRSKDKGY